MKVTPASGSVGAWVEGVDLRRVDGGLRAEILEAWHQHGVLFFRGQHLSPAEQLDAATIFGTPQLFPFAPAVGDEHPMVHLIANDANRRARGSSTWHADATWRPDPPRGSMLQAVVLPSVGGDTLFASAAAAYRMLSPAVQTLIDDLTASHHGGEPLARSAARIGLDIPPDPVHHRVALPHPATGDRCLYVNRLFTKHIDGLAAHESAALLGLLWDQFTNPEIQCRFQWAVGDVAVWDNRAVQHYATPDYDEPRTMHRVVLAGEPTT